MSTEQPANAPPCRRPARRGFFQVDTRR